VLVDIDPTALLDLTANAGDLCLLLDHGSLTSGQFVGNTVHAPTSGATIFLGTNDGSIDFSGAIAGPSLFSGLAHDKLRLEAHGLLGDITLGMQTLVFSEVTLTAD